MKIRVWKLGSLDHKIFPTQMAIKKLSDMLLNLIDNDTNDLIWGPDLKVELIEIDDHAINIITPDFTFSKDNIQKIQDFIMELANSEA